MILIRRDILFILIVLTTSILFIRISYSPEPHVETLMKPTVNRVSEDIENGVESDSSTRTKREALTDFPSCHPKDVFVRWSIIRLYLLKYRGKNIPNIYEGTPLKVRRCLYFMATCSYDEALCLTSSENLVVRTITLKSSGKVVGYYHILFSEDVECTCTNNTAQKDSIDYPWDPPFIIDSKFVNK